MGGKIPEPIRREVISQWLHGKTRDQIAKDNSIETGTVSEIINQYRQRDSAFDLMRQVALTLKEQQTDIRSFAAAIRLRRILEEAGLSEDDMESLIVNAEVHCFKRGMKLQEFFNIVDEVSAYCNMIGIPLKELPDHITQHQNILKQLKQEIKKTKAKKEENDLANFAIPAFGPKEFSRDKPLIDGLAEVQEKLHNVTQQRDSCYKELEEVKTELTFKKHEWMVIEPELDKTNEQLANYGSSSKLLDATELYQLAQELYHSPSKYVDIIKTMRERI
jgi:chromosome segregation ATPase